MQKLIDGLHDFQRNVFGQRREFFERLAHGQSPEVLFITCSDSRINPNLITQTHPGDLFIIRNAGNIVPPHGPIPGGETATIEFAVSGLKVTDIVVCGHSHCGAMQALLDPSKVTDMPCVSGWLAHADATRRIMHESYGHLAGNDLLTATVQENVLVQLEHVRTQPAVAAALAEGRLRLHGWVYKIETGEVFAFDAEQRQFLPITAVPVASATATAAI